jgi:hypothetical protein
MRLPPNRPERTICTVLLAVALALAARGTGRDVRVASEREVLPGVPNFARVGPRLYRGGQPSTTGLHALRQLGIGAVVRLTLGEEGEEAERRDVESLGMTFLGLPWSSVHDPPAGYIQTFLAFRREHPDQAIFVHCKAGSDRTGVMIAAYRIAVDHWTPARALTEMDAFGYEYTFLPHLTRYVEMLPQTLYSEPQVFDSSSVD